MSNMENDLFTSFVMNADNDDFLLGNNSNSNTDMAKVLCTNGEKTINSNFEK